jgi:hypothetical protein
MYQANKLLAGPSLWVRLADSLFVVIAILDFYNSLVIYPVVIIPALSFAKPVVFFLNAVITAATVLTLAVYFITWQRNARKGVPDNGYRHAWCIGIIRYWLAVEIFNYGFAKILGTQFAFNYFRGDSTWNSLSGFDLTWNYFAYSPALSDIIAALQVGGSALLLFRRTTVMGVLLLLPVMTNVLLIDIFYHIASGALLNAFLFTAALLYLLALHCRQIAHFLKRAQLNLPAVGLKGWKQVIRILAAVYAFGFIFYVTTTRQPASLTGKWKVRQLVLNGDTMKPGDWLQNAKAWQHVYLETYGRATFSPNPYVVEAGRSVIGLYQYNEALGAASFSMHPDTGGQRVSYRANIVRSDAEEMDWNMTSPQDTIQMALTKIQ